jgi:hypothetical protein
MKASPSRQRDLPRGSWNAQVALIDDRTTVAQRNTGPAVSPRCCRFQLTEIPEALHEEPFVPKAQLGGGVHAGLPRPDASVLDIAGGIGDPGNRRSLRCWDQADIDTAPAFSCSD